MKLRYEIKDTHNPGWRGPRYSNLKAAKRELWYAVPPGRFVLIDRETGKEISCPHCHGTGKAPSSDYRTPCGFCDDGVIADQAWKF